MSDDLLISDLRKSIADKRVVVVVGSGVSVAATNNAPCASWTGLLRDGAERAAAVAIPKVASDWKSRVLAEIAAGRNDLDELLSAAEKISTKLGAGKNSSSGRVEVGGEYRKWLRDTVGSLRAKNSTILDALAALDCPIATTNYDQLLEDATGMPPVTWLDVHEVTRVLQGEERGILHLHGFWKKPESVVLGLRSYDRVLSNELAQTLLHSLRTTKTLLFVGFGAGMADPNFSALLQWSRRVFSGDEYRHFRLAQVSEVAALQAQHPPEERIFVLPYGSSHEDLLGFLRSLTTAPVGSSLGAGPNGSLIPLVTPPQLVSSPATPAKRRSKMLNRAGASLALGLLIAIAAFGGRYGVHRYQANKLLTTADAAFARGDLSQAIAGCNSALALYSSSEHALTLRLQAQFEQFDCGAVTSSADKVLAIDPKNSMAYACRSMCQYFRGKRDMVDRDAAEAVALAPGNAMAHVAQASAFIMKYDFANAIGSARRAVQLDPASAYPHLTLGQVLAYGSNPDFVAAKAECEEAIRLRQLLAEAWACRGVVLLLAGENTKALADGEEAVRLAPHLPHGHFIRVATQLALGRFKEAVASGAVATQVAPESPLTLSIHGYALAASGDPKAGLKFLDRALVIDPGYAEGYLYRAIAHAVAGVPESGIEDVTKAISLNSRLTEAYLYRGLIYLQQEKLDIAADDFGAAVSMGSNNPMPHEYSIALNLRLSRWDAAVDALKTAIQRLPKKAGYQVQLCEALLLRGDVNAALAALSEARRLDPTTTDRVPGVTIDKLAKASRASQCGLRIGDVLVSYNGRWPAKVLRVQLFDADDDPPERLVRVLRDKEILTFTLKKGDLKEVSFRGKSSVEFH